MAYFIVLDEKQVVRAGFLNRLRLDILSTHNKPETLASVNNAIWLIKT